MSRASHQKCLPFNDLYYSYMIQEGPAVKFDTRGAIPRIIVPFDQTRNLSAGAEWPGAARESGLRTAKGGATPQASLVKRWLVERPNA